MSTPVIDLSPSKSALATTQAPIFTATTSTTTITRPLTPPLQQQQSTTDLELSARVMVLKQKFAAFEQKKAVQIALQAPIRDRFRDLPEEDMIEMLHQRMFESGTYKSLPKHIAFYEALEASMAQAQRDEFLAEKDKSRKRHCDDQDPPPPPPDSDFNALLSSFKQQSGLHAEQPVKNIPIPDSATLSDSEDTDSTHLLKTKQRPEWLKPILDDERPATPKPAWVIPTSHIPDVEKNWAKALATTYQAPAKNSLLEKTGDMRTFRNWYC
ncbi:hypothetical protein Tco_1218947 [Tanacetum coccineum]